MSSEIQDYNKWTRDFSNSFSSSSQRFLGFFSTFESMIDEYFENYSLLPPYDNRTNDFLYRFVPDIASKIYRLSNIKDDALELSVNQLLKILNLCVFLAEQCDFKLNKTMKLILNPNQYIYKYNNQLFQMLCELFVSYDYFQRLVSRCRECKPNIKNLSLVFSIRAKLFQSVQIELSEILPILPDFISQFKGDSIRTIDSTKLNSIIQKNIIPYFPRKTANNVPTIDFSPFFHFCELLIISGNLDKQLLGIKFLNSYLSNSAKDMTSFNSWIKSNSESKQLLDYLIQTPELHLEFIKSLEPLFVYLSSSHLINIDFFNQMFLTAKKMSKEESSQFFKLLVKSLDSMSDDQSIIKKFINEHKDSSELLVSFVLDSENNSSDCISYLFENKALNEILSIINNKTKKMILDETLKIAEKNQKAAQFDKDEIETASEVLSILINRSTSLRTDFGPNLSEFIRKVILNFSFKRNLKYVYSILGSYYIKAKQPLEIEILPEILDFHPESNNDELWRFFIKIMKSNKRNSIKKEVCDSLYIIINDSSNEYFPLSTPLFIEFFRYLIIIKCSQDYTLQFNSYDSLEDFKFRRYPSSCMPLLIKLYFSTKEHELMNSFMYEVLTRYNSVPIKDEFQVLTTQFIPKLNDGNNIINYYIIKLIYDVLTNVEKGIQLEDLSGASKRRHCEITDDSIELTLVTVGKDKKTVKEIKKIHSSTNEYCDSFLKRIRKIFNDPNATAFCQKITLNQHSQLKNVSIKRNCQITVEGNYRPSRENVLSLMLTEKNSTLFDPLFKILRNVKKEDSQLAEIITKLLQFLPSCQDINLDLTKCENSFILIYCIQILAGFSTMDDEKINSLVNIFHSRKYKNTDSQIIQIFIRFFDKEKLPKYMELLIGPLFECINSCNVDPQKKQSDCYDIYNLNSSCNSKFNDLNHILLSLSQSNKMDENDELSEKAIKLLKKLTKNRKDSDSILQNYVDGVVEMSLHVKDSTARKIFRIIDCLSNLSVFFSKFIQKIPMQSSDNKIIFKLFYTMWKEMSDEGQITNEEIVKTLFQKCIDWIDFPSIDLLRSCLIVRKTIKSLIISKMKLEGIIDQVDHFVTKMFDQLFLRDSKDFIAPIFRLIEKFVKYDTKFNLNHLLLNIIDKCLLNYFSKVGKSKHYNMSESKYPKTLYTGLQNIGSTCFVNTIIQPLFYTYQFRYNVLFNVDPEKNVMQDLFVKMLTTQRGYVKMMDFLVQFEKDIEIHRQQDCVEFLLILSEKLDKESYNLFKGVLTDHFTSTYSSSDNKIATSDSRDEDFIHLSVNVQKFTNLEESLKSLFGSSVVVSGSEQTSSENVDSNMQKYSRIKIAPQFLIISLNRFEYNLKTFKKIKINSKFSFPFVLDVSEFIEEKQNQDENDVFSMCKDNYKYELYAVSLHNGSADSGHYTALVKVNKNWIEFNDRSSRIITEDELKTLSFGGDINRSQRNERNAYVLYYRRILEIKNNVDDNNNNENDAKVDSKVVDLYDEDKINQIFMRFSEKIEKTEHLSLYTEDEKVSFNNYAISDSNSNPNVSISYFFNVFCHSSSKDAKSFVDKLIQKINDHEKGGELLYNFLLNEKESYCPKLSEIFLKCKTDQILLSIRNLLLHFCENPKCKDVFTQLLSSLSTFREKPYQVDSITPLFINYVTVKSPEGSKSHTQIARELKWNKIILDFFDFCSSKMSESDQKKVRLTDLLLLLKNLITNDVDSKENVKTMSKEIMDSIKKNIKFLLMNSFNSLSLFDLFNSLIVYCPISSSYSPSSQMIKMIENSSRSDTKHKLIMSFIIGLIECDAETSLISDCLNYEVKKTELSSFFRDYLRSPTTSSVNLQHFLVENYTQLILPELLSSRKETRQKAEHLTYDIFVDIKPPSNSPQYTSTSTTQNAIPSENLLRFSKGFSDSYFEKVNSIISEMTAKAEKNVIKLQGGKTITTTKCTRDYDYYIFENFFRVLKWTMKRCNNCNNAQLERSIFTDKNKHYRKVFENIYDCFMFIDANNDRSLNYTPDPNYRAILDVFKAIPYGVILNSSSSMDVEVADKIESVVLNSIDFVPGSNIATNELSKTLLMISTVRNAKEKQSTTNNLLLKIYENPKFVDFFKNKKKVRQDTSLFDKFYGPSLPDVLEMSELYRKESILILDNPLNFFVEYSLLTTVLSTIYRFLPGKFVIKVISWVVKCINEQRNPPTFMETVLSINESVRNGAPFSNSNRIPFEELFVKSASLKSYASTPVSASKSLPALSIDKNCEILKSFDKIGYKSKMQYEDSIFYFTLIKYICKGCRFQASSDQSLAFLLDFTDEILVKLLNKLTLIDGRNFSNFAFELSAFFDLALEEQKYELVSQFIDSIFPLSSIANWFYYTKIYNNFLKFYAIAKIQDNRVANKEINSLFECLLSVTKNTLMSVDITSYSSKNALTYVQSFLSDSSDDVFKRTIKEVVDNYNTINDNNVKKIITTNLRKITRLFPDYSEFTKSLIKM